MGLMDLPKGVVWMKGATVHEALIHIHGKSM